MAGIEGESDTPAGDVAHDVEVPARGSSSVLATIAAIDAELACHDLSADPAPLPVGPGSFGSY